MSRRLESWATETIAGTRDEAEQRAVVVLTEARLAAAEVPGAIADRGYLERWAIHHGWPPADVLAGLDRLIRNDRVVVLDGDICPSDHDGMWFRQ